MNVGERLSYASRNLTYRTLRTWLTVLGVVVGIAAIIVLVGLAGGLRESVDRQLATFDPRMIMVFPVNIGEQSFSTAGSGFMASAGKLYDRDYQKVRGIPGVQSVAKMIGNRASVKYKSKFISATIYAVEPGTIQEVSTINVEEGRFIDDSDTQAAVLGYNIAHDTFDEKVEVGSSIEIAERRYRVVGILEKTGNSFAQLDNVIYINFNEGRSMFSDLLLPNELSGMRVLASEGYDVEEVAERIEEVLMSMHKVKEDEKDFSVITSKSLNEQIDSIIGVLTLFLGAVAAIALTVGTIGISNTMFMAVMERTKEVGVLKSIGATRGEILQIFLIEAGIIGLLGGVFGIILGVGFCAALGLFGVNTNVTPALVLGSSVFAFIVGVGAGLVPAKNASEIPAIEALRYE